MKGVVSGVVVSGGTDNATLMSFAARIAAPNRHRACPGPAGLASHRINPHGGVGSGIARRGRHLVCSVPAVILGPSDVIDLRDPKGR